MGTFLDKDISTERQHIDAMLVVGDGLYIDDAAVGLGLGLALVEHTGTHIDGVVDEHGIEVLDILVTEVGNGLAADIGHGDAYSQGEHQCAYHQDLTMLIVAGIVDIGMHGMVIHGEETEEIVVALENGLREGMTDLLPYDEIFVI